MIRKQIVGLTVACALAAPAFAASGSVTINATVPSSCSASLTITATGDNPQRIVRANVQRNCNATHTLAVTYQPANLTSNSLVILFDGSPPTSTAPGRATFADLPATNSTAVLTITYGGPKAERLQIGQTLAIQMSAP